MNSGLSYGGDELSLFATATHWKSYWRSHVAQFIHGDVLEVGAGIGANTRLLYDEKVRRWVCLEPDPKLAAHISAYIRSALIGKRCEVVVGTLATLGKGEYFDSILYIDVLEHIEDDRAELSHAADHLRSGGKLSILAPAHQWLFTPFDEVIGHRRRYTRATLRSAAPEGFQRETLIYLDSVGLLASMANRFLLNSTRPRPRQIKLWDTLLVPCSRWLDPVLRYSIGKSILGVWRKSP